MCRAATVLKVIGAFFLCRYTIPGIAGVAELADARDLGSRGG